ncbi:MAG: hypothetical protein IPN90_09550 [Elusimicrobia bacterium]|nr:hypothetical protein [Elusimicrobiota bacterium]
MDPQIQMTIAFLALPILGTLLFWLGGFHEKKFSDIPLSSSAVCVGFLGLSLFFGFMLVRENFKMVIVLGSLVNLLFGFVWARGMFPLLLGVSDSISYPVPRPPKIPTFWWVLYGGTGGILRRSAWLWVIMFPLVWLLGIIQSILPRRFGTELSRSHKSLLYAWFISFSANLVTLPLYFLSPESGLFPHFPNIVVFVSFTILLIFLFSFFGVIGGFVGKIV